MSHIIEVELMYLEGVVDSTADQKCVVEIQDIIVDTLHLHISNFMNKLEGYDTTDVTISEITLIGDCDGTMHYDVWIQYKDELLCIIKLFTNFRVEYEIEKSHVLILQRIEK